MPPTTQAPASVKIKQFNSLVSGGMSDANARKSVRGMTTDGTTPPSFTTQTDKFGRQERIYKDGTSEFNETPQSYYGKAGSSAPQRTGFKVDMPSTIPSDALNGTYSITDVRAMRDNKAQADASNAQFNTDYGNLTSRIGNTKLSSPFVDPEKFLNGLLLRGNTSTQDALDTKMQGQADNIRKFSTDYTQAGTDARAEFGIPELQTSLAETRTKIADRQVKLRETLRDFETNAQRRGVAREFVTAEKQKVQADAAAELADLAIIESSQLGNLTEARAEVDRVLTEKKQAFDFENAAITAEISRLEKMDTRESQARSEQLQIALDERKRNIETALANEKESRSYLIDAAQNGADTSTLDTMRSMIANGVNPSEVAFAGSAYIGRLDRQQKEANIANTYSALSSRNLNDTIALAEKGDKNAIEKLGFDPRKSGGNFEAESGLRKEFNALPTVKEAVAVQQSYKSINSALEQALNATKTGGSPAAADQALIISFNKMLDPNSVVREGEFARSTQGQAYLDQVQAKLDAAMRGGAGLTDQMRTEIANTTRVLYSDYVKTHNDTAFGYRENALRQGADPKYVAGYIDTLTDPKEAQDGDILVLHGIPMQKQGDTFVKLDI